MIKLAKRNFGTTKDCNIAAYILSDGKLLDFSMDLESGKDDHVMIKEIYDRNDSEGTESFDSIYITKFLHDTGSMRFHHGQNTTWVEMSNKHEPTFEQFEAVRVCACRQGLDPHRIVYDIRDKRGEIIKSGESREQFREVPCNTIVNKFMHQLMREYGGR